MASSNLSRDDFPIVCITEATEVCHTLSKGTTPKKLDSPTSDDSCVDSMFSSKESSLVLDDMKTRGENSLYTISIILIKPLSIISIMNYQITVEWLYDIYSMPVIYYLILTHASVYKYSC